MTYSLPPPPPSPYITVEIFVMSLTGTWRVLPSWWNVDRETRNRGLLGHRSFPRGVALVLAPCSAIHTWFMRFPIDVIFANRDGVVVKVCRNVRPWRIAFAWGAFAAIEFAAGEAVQSTSTVAGDRLRIVTRS